MSLALPTSPLEISRVSVKIPPFWKTNSKLWFSQIESQFFNSGISQDATKYHALVGSVESDILNAVSHIIENPPTQNMYDTLKSALLNEFQDSEEKRLQKLLENIQLGDKRPSTLLREMRQLSSGKMSDDMLKSLWFQRLPATLKAVLSISSDSLDKLAVMADKINDQLDSSSLCQVSTPSQTPLEQIEKQISELIQRIDAINSPLSHGRNRSRKEAEAIAEAEMYQETYVGIILRSAQKRLNAVLLVHSKRKTKNSFV
ncbi:uncharacterized protein LOC119599715 [Lucilia sericata]|uniref:uncharacterized protein LOC119599715 n=1 Tax=Lucilia sericata TaxID=13632 RepID=UPI0018A85A6E|nr:uncharacterized protein LOC119599715 [Lucilia sericata]